MHRQFCAAQRARQRCAGQRENQGRHGHDGEIAKQRLRGGARPAQAGVDKRQAGNGQRGNEQQRQRQPKDGVTHKGNGGRAVHERPSARRVM